jgi:hypothetical protein
MTRATKYLLAFIIMGLIYLIVYGLHSQLSQDAYGLGWLFIYLTAMALGFIGALLGMIIDSTKSSLAYLSTTFFNLSLGHIFFITGFNGVFISFLLPVIMGITMLALHIIENKKE